MDIPDFPLQRHGDKELVRTFLQHGVHQPQLEALHQCRMYLQVLRLSDICTGTGDRLLTGNWRQYHPMPSEYNWPKAENMSAADWEIWNSTLTTVFNVGRNLKLPQPMGPYFTQG